MGAEIKTITSVTERGLKVIKEAQEASTNAFKEFAEVKLPQILGEKFEPLVVAIQRLAAATEDVGRAVGDSKETPALAEHQQAQVFLCMRTLNRVEDITIDKEPGLTQNNNELNRIRNDDMVNACLEALSRDEVLQRRVTQVHREFLDLPRQEETQDRLERFWEIQELRSDIIAHFAAQSAPTPGSPTLPVE